MNGAQIQTLDSGFFFSLLGSGLYIHHQYLNDSFPATQIRHLPVMEGCRAPWKTHLQGHGQPVVGHFVTSVR